MITPIDIIEVIFTPDSCRMRAKTLKLLYKSQISFALTSNVEARSGERPLNAETSRKRAEISRNSWNLSPENQCSFTGKFDPLF